MQTILAAKTIGWHEPRDPLELRPLRSPDWIGRDARLSRKVVLHEGQEGPERRVKRRVIHLGNDLLVRTGHPAGEADANGEFPIGSINHTVEVRLATLLRNAQKYAAATRKKKKGGPHKNDGNDEEPHL